MDSRGFSAHLVIPTALTRTIVTYWSARGTVTFRPNGWFQKRYHSDVLEGMTVTARRFF